MRVWIFEMKEDLRRTQLLDAETSQPLAQVDALVQRTAGDDTGAETAGKGVARAVGVVDLLLGDLVHRVLLDLVLALDGDDGGLGALRDDGHALALRVLLGQVRQCLGNLLDVLGAQLVGVGVGLGLGLVADHVVPVGGGLVERGLEELADEGSGEGQDEGLVRGGGLLGKLLDGRRADWTAWLAIAEARGGGRSKLTGEVVAANIVGLGVLDERPDIRALQVLQVIVVGSAQLGAHAAVVASDDDGATAGGLLGVDAILDAQTGLPDGFVEDTGILVVAGTAQVDNAVFGEYVLGTAGRVLGGAAGDQLGIKVVEEVLEDALVLGLGQDGIVGLETVLLEQGVVSDRLDVWQGRKVPLLARISRRPTICERRGESGLDAVRMALARNKMPVRCALTEEGVLQTEESVVLGGCHVDVPAVVLRRVAVERICAPRPSA